MAARIPPVRRHDHLVRPQEGHAFDGLEAWLAEPEQEETAVVADRGEPLDALFSTENGVSSSLAATSW